MIICTSRIREWELQIWNWSASVQPEIAPLFTISFQCLKKKKILKNWQVYDWLAKWLIMSGYMDLRRPRVYRRSNIRLVFSYSVAYLWVRVRGKFLRHRSYFVHSCPLGMGGFQEGATGGGLLIFFSYSIKRHITQYIREIDYFSRLCKVSTHSW